MVGFEQHFLDGLDVATKNSRDFFFVTRVRDKPESTNLINNLLKMVARSGFCFLYFSCLTFKHANV